MSWEKWAIRGDTYARALQNAGQRAGRTFGPDAFAHIAAQSQATLKPGLSSFVREPGALPPTPQSAAMQDLAHKMPWAGEEHTTEVNSARAEGRFNRLLDRQGLSVQSPQGNTQAMITKSFGTPDQFRAQRRRENGEPAAVPTKALPSESRATAVLPKGQSTMQRGHAAPMPPVDSQARTNIGDRRALAPTTPAPLAASSPNRFPRARFQMGKVAHFKTGLEGLLKAS